MSYGGCAQYVTAFGSCFGNNAITPYYVLQVPLGDTTLPSYLAGFHPSGNASINTFYKLHASEALITIITVPPLAAYYSQQSYMVVRDAHWYDPINVPPGGTTCVAGTTFPTPNGEFHDETPDCSYDVFGYFNNAINDVVVQQQAGFAFSGTPSCTSQCAVAVVTTPDHALYMHIVAVFGQLGYNPNLLFEEGMATGAGTPSPLLRIDTTTYNPDIFATVFRYSIPQDGNGPTSASLAYQTAIGANILTFRVTQPFPYQQLSAVPTPTITKQACNTNEANYNSDPTPLCSTAANSSVQADLGTLTTMLQSWMASHVSSSYATATASSPFPMQGFACLVGGTACQGAIPDTDAYRGYPPVGGNAPILHLAAGLPIIGVGVLHSASPGDTTSVTPANNAVYTGFGINDNKLNSGMTGENIGKADQVQTNLLATGFSSKQQLSGSAAKIFSDLGLSSNDNNFLNDLPNFYVVVFNQTVSGVPCVLPGSQSSTSCDQFYVVNLSSGTLPTADPVKISERAYLYPPASASSPPSTAMQIGADPYYLLSPKIIAVPSTQ